MKAMASKAWVDVPPTQSVPGTEDDETFYKEAEERKKRKNEYKEKNRPMYRYMGRRWYVANRENERERRLEKRRIRNMTEE